jgi:hypothetical protein
LLVNVLDPGEEDDTNEIEKKREQTFSHLEDVLYSLTKLYADSASLSSNRLNSSMQI